MPADSGNVAQNRSGAAHLSQLEEPIGQRDDDHEQHTDQRDHDDHERAHRRTR
jgi:hypothetical protein